MGLLTSARFSRLLFQERLRADGVAMRQPGRTFLHRRIFDRRGFTQLSSSLITPAVCPAPELADYWGHVLRVFGRRR